jgi:hypothetical protein
LNCYIHLVLQSDLNFGFLHVQKVHLITLHTDDTISWIKVSPVSLSEDSLPCLWQPIGSYL